MIATKNTVLRSAMLGLIAFVMSGLATAQGNSRSFEASPDVYKVLSQSDQYVVVEITWKPGQRDKFHSHPASGGYYLTDCKLRGHAPTGMSMEIARSAGDAFANPPIRSHSMENIGSSVCRVIQFEPK